MALSFPQLKQLAAQVFVVKTGGPATGITRAAKVVDWANKFIDAIAERIGIIPGPNLRPDLRKAVRWYSDQVPGYDAQGPVLLPGADVTGLDAATCCLATTIDVEFDEGGQYGTVYRFVYDVAGDWQIWRDATFTGEKVQANLVRIDSPEAQAGSVIAYSPALTYVRQGTNVLHTLPDRGARFEALVDLRNTNFPPGNVIPAPAGSSADSGRWKELPIGSPGSSRVTVSWNAFKPLYQAGQLLPDKVYVISRYLVEGDAESGTIITPLPPVYVWTTSTGSILPLAVLDPTGAAKLGSYNVLADTFTEGGLGGGAGVDAFYLEDETKLFIESGGQPYGVDLGEALAPYRSGRRLFVVEGNGQPVSTYAGTFARPFDTLTQGYNAAVAGSSVVVLRGGPGLDSLGRPTYTDGVSVTRNVNWQGIGGPVLAQYFELGAYAGAARRIRITGLEFLLRSVVLKPGSGSHQIEYADCRWQGQAFLQLFGQGVSNADRDVITVRRSSFTCLQADGGYGCVLFSQRDDIGQQAQTLILEDCDLSAVATPLFTGTIHPDSRVILRGHTRLLVPDGYPLSSMTRHTGGLVAEADWLIDERASTGGGSDATELAGQFQGSDPQQADLYIYADAVGTYQVHSVTGVTGVSYQRNGAPATLPVSVVQGDTLSILATGAGTVRLRKQS